MKFTIHELREVLPLEVANNFIAVLNSQRYVVHRKKSRYMPFKSRYGKESTILQNLNEYDLDEIIELYESRLTSPNHRHVIKGTTKYLKLMYKIKELL